MKITNYGWSTTRDRPGSTCGRHRPAARRPRRGCAGRAWRARERRGGRRSRGLRCSRLGDLRVGQAPPDQLRHLPLAAGQRAGDARGPLRPRVAERAQQRRRGVGVRRGPDAVERRQRGPCLDDRQLRRTRGDAARASREPGLRGVEGQPEPVEDRQRRRGSGRRPSRGRRGRRRRAPPRPPRARPPRSQRLGRAERVETLRPTRAAASGSVQPDQGLDEQREQRWRCGRGRRRRPGSAPAGRPRPPSPRGPDTPGPGRGRPRSRPAAPPPPRSGPGAAAGRRAGERHRVRHRAGPPGHPDRGGELALGLRPPPRRDQQAAVVGPAGGVHEGAAVAGGEVVDDPQPLRRALQVAGGLAGAEHRAARPDHGRPAPALPGERPGQRLVDQGQPLRDLSRGDQPPAEVGPRGQLQVDVTGLPRHASMQRRISAHAASARGP